MGEKGKPLWTQIASNLLKLLSLDKIVGCELQVQAGSLMLSGKSNKWKLQQKPEQPFLPSAHSAQMSTFSATIGSNK